MTLFLDNQNAVIILLKGSPKPRLQFYATAVADLCLEFQVMLRPIWIPLDLNNVADWLSKSIHWDDFSVTVEFYNKVCQAVGEVPEVDCFADNYNTKAQKFFSKTYCPLTWGVDAFSCVWDPTKLHWIFVQPSMVARAVNYLKLSKVRALCLVPQWKFSHFYPRLMDLCEQGFVQEVYVFPGDNAFIQGSDPTSYFGPSFKANIEVWDVDCTDS